MESSASSSASSASHLFRPLSIPPAESFKVAMQFGHETEAGRMLARLYGRSQEPVSAPARAFKSRPMAGPQPPMVGVHARGGAADPRARTFDHARAERALEQAPKPAGAPRAAPVAPIDRIKGMIRSKAQVDALEAVRGAGDIAQPPLKRGFNGDLEKRRLQATFALKGGKAVPDAASYAPIEGAIPLHVLTGQRAAGARAPGAYGSGASARAAARRLSPNAQLVLELERTFESVQRGLDESVAFIAELRELRAATARHESEHAAELAKRTRQLNDLQRRIRELQAKEDEDEARGAGAAGRGGAGGGGRGGDGGEAGRGVGGWGAAED